MFYMKGLQGVVEIENNDSNSKGLQLVGQFDERGFQKEMVDKVSDFLFELSEGFVYMGKEYHLNLKN